jgi:type IV pilus assembly protein PilA
MLNKLRQRVQDEKGFTLIELLVVILIIGILAAIALPAFLGQRTKAQDTEAKTQIRTMQTAIETYYTDNQDYTGADLTKLKVIEPSLNDGKATPQPPSGESKTAYTLSSKSASGNTFTLTRDVSAGTTTRNCTVPGSSGNNGGGCNGGSW